MRLACIAFVIGAWCLQQQATLPEKSGFVAAAVVASLLLLFNRKIHKAWLRHIPVFIGCLALGFCWAAWRADLRLSDELPASMEGQDVVVIGTVDNLPYIFEQGTRFNFRVENVLSAGVRQKHIPQMLSLSWYSSYYGVDEEEGVPIQNLQPGERWQLTVRLRKPHGNANPDGFDYEYWLLENNLRATGYVRPSNSAAPNRRLDDFVWRFDYVVERARALLRERIQQSLGDAPYAGVITALVIGDQRSIGQSDWQVYNRTGIGHLVSISGLHITMIAGLAATLVFALWRRSPRLMVRLPAHKAAALAGAITALLYCLLAGYGVPAQRTLYMLSMVALALWMGRITSASHVLCAALLVVVLLDPWAVMAAGFWLSFAAVAAIFYVTTGRIQETAAEGWQGKSILLLRQGARIQWAVTLGLMPLTMLLFHQVSVISPIANAIAIPLVSLIVTPLALVGAMLSVFKTNLIGILLLQIAHTLMAWLAWILGWMSTQPLTVWTGATPTIWAFVCAMFGVLWCLAPRGIPMRWLGILWLIPLFAWPPDRPASGSARMTALDVGQGMAVLIETAHHNVLYDTGPQYSADNDGDNNAGQRVILPLLRARGITKLDAMIVSHNDNDHSGGALSILNQMPVDVIFSSLATNSPLVQTAASRHRRCEAGQKIELDGVHFEMLHPTVGDYEQTSLKTNARSCVLRITVHNNEAGSKMQSALLAGDIERQQELELIDRTAPEAIQSDVLLVPHHGSKTSSSEEFLNAINPHIALIQSGYRNRFGHPKPEVLERYIKRGVEVHRNDREGAVTLVLGTQESSLDAYRLSHARYWYGR